MNKLKTLVVALAIGLAGVAYANNPNDSLPIQDKADCCRAGAACCDSGSCCAKNKGPEFRSTRQMSEDCCEPGATCCDGGSCCPAKSGSKSADQKSVQKSDGVAAKNGEAACCSAGSACCDGGSCCAKRQAGK